MHVVLLPRLLVLSNWPSEAQRSGPMLVSYDCTLNGMIELEIRAVVTFYSLI